MVIILVIKILSTLQKACLLGHYVTKIRMIPLRSHVVAGSDYSVYCEMPLAEPVQLVTQYCTTNILTAQCKCDD